MNFERFTKRGSCYFRKSQTLGVPRQSLGLTNFLLLIAMLICVFISTTSFADPIDNYIVILPVTKAGGDLRMTVQEFLTEIQGPTNPAKVTWKKTSENYYVLYLDTTKPLKGNVEREAIGFLLDKNYAIIDAYMGPNGREMNKHQLEKTMTPILINIARTRKR